MGELLHGTMKLKIESVRNTRRDTDRYNATEISSGRKVSVRFKNHGKDPHTFVGKTGVFDGDDNDIQTDPQQRIDQKRSHGSFNNPFI
jgi:hypothetical protein